MSYPGATIQARGVPGFGSILGYFRSAENGGLYLGSAGHVIAGRDRYPRRTRIEHQGETIADYRRGQPGRRIRYVDILFAELRAEHVGTNAIPNQTLVMRNVVAPEVGMRLRLFGARTQTDGLIEGIGIRGLGRYSLAIRYTGDPAIGGDSGAPWVSDAGELVCMHLGGIPNDPGAARALYLTEVLHYYSLVLQ